MSIFNTIIEKLKTKDEVDAVFVTGSYGIAQEKSYSDIDLVIILRKNTNKLKSVYTWIDGVFADIFFFDRDDLKRIMNAPEIPASSMEALLLSWLAKSSIKFDKTGTITAIKHDLALQEKCKVPANEQWEAWRKINYNFVANSRYFASDDSLYHKALEIRLMYSVAELITCYFTLRGISWRGEKNAVEYLEKSAPDFYSLFQQYIASSDLQSRFQMYQALFEKTLPSGFSRWSTEDTIIESHSNNKNQEELLKYWRSLFLA